MAFMDCRFFSEALEVSVSMHVILPQEPGLMNEDREGHSGKYPTLYLLHGLSDDHTIWSRFTSIERYVSQLGIAVVMPAVNRSFYTDMAHGYDYFTFISQEVPRVARSFFPLSAEREDNYVAGLSMGGYGALKTAMRCPDDFYGAASLSGAVDIACRIQDFGKDFEAIFGDREIEGSDDDLFHLAEKVSARTGPKPKLYVNCGTEDHLYESNLRFRDHCKSLPLDMTYEEAPGEHEWGYWDKHIQAVLNLFFGKNNR